MGHIISQFAFTLPPPSTYTYCLFFILRLTGIFLTSLPSQGISIRDIFAHEAKTPSRQRRKRGWVSMRNSFVSTRVREGREEVLQVQGFPCNLCEKPHKSRFNLKDCSPWEGSVLKQGEREGRGEFLWTNHNPHSFLHCLGWGRLRSEVEPG